MLTAPPCPTPATAASLPARPHGGVLRGDMDGDGRADRVLVRFAPAAPASCAFFLVVATRNGTAAIRIPESYKGPTSPYDRRARLFASTFEEPYVSALLRLDGRVVAVVPRARGASVVTVSFYAMSGGRLVLLRFPNEELHTGLYLGGTVGTGATDAVCLGHRLVTESVWPAYNKKGRYLNRTFYEARTYRLVGRGFHVVARRRTERSGTWPGPPRWWPKARGFASCLVARGHGFWP